MKLQTIFLSLFLSMCSVFLLCVFGVLVFGLLLEMPIGMYREALSIFSVLVGILLFFLYLGSLNE